MTNLIIKALLLSIISLLAGCGSNEIKENTNSNLNPSKLQVKDGIVYNYGAQNEAPSKVAKIINRSNDTRIIEIDSEKVPHPLLGSPLTTFVTAPGQRMLTIKYYDGGSYMSGAPVISAKVDEGKVYVLTSENLSGRISYKLKDLSTNKMIAVPFIRQKQ